MPVRIVDASALGALLFGEPRAEETARALGSGALAAPALLPFELASVCLKKITYHPEQSNALIDALDLFRRMAIDIIEVDHSEAVMLARDTGLTTYDASYLWLTRKLAGQLVTLDERLRAAASAHV